ncbi:hypothetical protein PUN28_001527 [Cardiocondyla obscurior]|uniref:Uncharacterized protein n=1 Tax=Cardiocondyla obscurior TaxID=286306 RepID=A0AAW2H5E9_9HYME
MLVPTIRRSVSCNLRRVAACVIYRNKIRTKITWHCNEANLLSISPRNITVCRVYSTDSDSESPAALPMLVAGADAFSPSLWTPFCLLYLSLTTLPYIDKEFLISDALAGAKYATTVISKALANKDFDSLEGLVAENMIEVLRAKIESLSPYQRSLIAVREEDITLHFLCNVEAKTTGEESYIEIKTICHYIPNKAEQKEILDSITSFSDLSKLKELLICNYVFTRKYVNNVGGPWIATFINHYSVNVLQ